MNTNQVIFKFIKIAFSIMLALLLVYGTISMAMISYDFGYRVFTEAPMDEEPGKAVKITIDEGMSKQEIGKLLKDNGLIRDENLFCLQLELSIYADKLLPGKYTLSTSMTAKEMMAVMATVPETEE